MNPLSLILGFLAGVFVTYIILSRGSGKKRMNKRKEEAKGQILAEMKKKEKITNEEVVTLLGVSPATAVRYMDELESEGKVQQMGSTGRNVFYSLNTSNAD